MNSKRFALSALGVSLWAASAMATSPIWQNTGVYSFLMDIPFYGSYSIAPLQIDATAVVNYGQMYVTNFYYNFIESGTGNVTSSLSYPLPFETLNTLHYTNYNLIQGFPGFRFDYFDSAAGRHRLAADFVNRGSVVPTNATVYSDIQLLVQASNIVNRGSLQIGDSGLLQLGGQNLDLARSTLESIGAETDPGAYVLEKAWAAESGTNAYISAPFNLVFNGDFSAYTYQIYSNVFSGYYDVNFVLLRQTNPAIATAVGFDGYSTNGAFRGIRWQGVATNQVTGEVITNTLYLFDQLGYILGLPPLDPTYHNTLQSFLVPTYSPRNYILAPGGFYDQFWSFLQQEPPSTFNTVGFNPNPDDANFIATTYDVDITPCPFVPNPAVAGSGFTNEPGRIELRASQVLDLTGAHIQGQSYLLLDATNHFAGSAKAAITSAYSDLNLRTTNGSLTVSNLLTPTIPRLCGSLEIWSGYWTNSIFVNGTNVPARFIATVVDSHLAPNFPAQIQSLSLRATDLVVADPLNVFGPVSLPDTVRLTIATNAPGALALTGELNLTSPDPVWTATLPRLSYLTNFGRITTPSLAFFGGARTPPWYTTSFTEPYQAFVNHGVVASAGQAIDAVYFESSGTNDSGSGSLTLQAGTAILTNGALFAANANLSISAGYLLASNEVLRAGGGLSLSAGAMTDGILNLANTDRTNWPSAAITNGNVWTTDYGLNLLSAPVLGDLLGTTVTNIGAVNAVVPNAWAATDLGNTPAGFLNNAALGRLVLVGAANTVFTFFGTGSSNALYVDSLELAGSIATNTDIYGNFTGVEFGPNMKIYFAQALANGISIAEKLDGRNDGRFNWVSNYNLGYFSSTNVLYPDGTTNRLNAALVQSCDIVSNTTNVPPVFNCINQVPVWPIPAPPAPADNVPLLAAFAAQPLSQTALQGTTVTFSVTASATQPLQYQWLHNGNPIPGKTTTNLVLFGVSSGDAGTYAVAVSSSAGVLKSADASLVVNTPPAITQQPAAQSVAVGGPVSFSVTAQGDAPLVYQWRFNGTDLAGATTATLARAAAQPADAGAYSVLVSNPFGAVTSSPASLVVQLGPAASPNLSWPALAPSKTNASVNAFVMAQGAYSGLFSDVKGAAAGSSGYFSAKVTRGGAYSGTLMLAGRTYALAGSFSVATSSATNKVVRGAGLSPLTVAMHLDLGDGGQILGSVSAGNTWSASLVAFRKGTAPVVYAGNYTLVISPDLGAANNPGGDGIGTAKVDAAGNVQFTGALADGTRVTQLTSVSQQGWWPLFSTLYSGSGCVLSWLHFTNQAATGQALWLRPSAAATKPYPAGFTNEVDAVLAPYAAPAAGTRLFGMTNATLVFSGGGLTTPVTNSFSLNARNGVVRPAGSKLSLSFTLASGLFSGSTWSAELNRTLTFQGVLNQPGSSGFGFFAGPKVSGQVYLAPAD